MRRQNLNAPPLWLRLVTFVGAVLIAVIITGCSTGAAADPTTTPPQDEQISQTAQTYITMSQEALADYLGIPVTEIELENITEPFEVDGTYIVTLNAQGQTYEYHGLNNEVLLVSDPLPTASVTVEMTGTAEVELTPSIPTGTYTATYTIEPALVNDVEIMIDEAAPSPVRVLISGQLRGGCEEIDESSAVMVDDSTFDVDLLTRRPNDVACTLALIAYTHTVSLEVQAADLAPGEYTVVVNDEHTATFLWPSGGEVLLPIQPAVSFSLTDTVAISTTTQVISATEMTETMPYWELFPTHTEITLQGYAQPDSLQMPRILVYPTSDFVMLNDAAAAQIDALRQLLTTEPLLVEAQTLPFLPLLNAAPVLHAQEQYLDFANGRGVRYLTQYEQAATPVNNQELFYTYQGLTDDGAYYVAAVFPVSHPDLPADVSAVPEGMSDDYETYLNNVTEQLNVAAAAAFTPDLTLLDTVINSLQVTGPDQPVDNGAVQTQADLVRELESAGATVALSTEPIRGADIFAVPGQIFFVNGEEITLYVYENAAAAASDAARVSADGFTIELPADSEGGEVAVDWINPPHFYRLDNLIALYVGTDESTLTLLESVLGVPFAGNP